MATRRHYDSRLKAQVALEAIKNQRTISEIASDYGVHPNQISKWKKKLLDEVPEIFSSKREKRQQDNEALQDGVLGVLGQKTTIRGHLRK